MRSLNKNMTKLWMVRPTGTTEETDGDGFYTGHKITSYSVPLIIYMNIMPTNGTISNEIFGNDNNFDKIGNSCSIELEPNDLLFLTAPIKNYYTTYDYSVSRINSSINNFVYGLRKRT